MKPSLKFLIPVSVIALAVFLSLADNHRPDTAAEQITAFAIDHYSSRASILERTLYEIRYAVLTDDLPMAKNAGAELLTAMHTYKTHHENGSLGDQDIFRLTVFALRAFDALQASQFKNTLSDELAELSNLISPFSYALLIKYPRYETEIELYANQKSWLGYVFLRNGEFLNSTEMHNLGVRLVNEVVADQTESGVFLELGGSDSHYQAVTLTALWHVYQYSNYEAKDNLLKSIKHGTMWQWQQVNGCVATNDNTRTALSAQLSSENKAINPIEISEGLLLTAGLVDKDADDVLSFLKSCSVN